MEDQADQLASKRNNDNLEDSATAESADDGVGDELPVPEQRSFISVIIHSFFIIPFLIAIFSGLLVVSWRILTNEPHTVYDYIADVKVGGATKRWQAAFELSKILGEPERLPLEGRFTEEMINLFKSSEHDDPRVRQYLALAMARTGLEDFIRPIADSISDESEGTRFMLLVALGMFATGEVLSDIAPYLSDNSARVRSGAATAIGLTGNLNAVELLQLALNDPAPSVVWDAALALARLDDLSGKEILMALLDRSHLAQFPNVDDRDQNLLMVTVIEVTAPLQDPDLQRLIAGLAKNDVNLNVRRIAQAAVSNYG